MVHGIGRESVFVALFAWVMAAVAGVLHTDNSVRRLRVGYAAMLLLTGYLADSLAPRSDMGTSSDCPRGRGGPFPASAIACPAGAAR